MQRIKDFFTSITPDKFQFYLATMVSFALMLAIAFIIAVGVRQYLSAKSTRGRRGVVERNTEKHLKHLMHLMVLGIFCALVIFAHTPFFNVSNTLVSKLNKTQDTTTNKLIEKDKSGTTSDVQMDK